jgi:hypothetical protein
VKKALTVLVGIVLGLLVLGVVADRGAVAYAQSQISDQVQKEMPGASSVDTQIEGFPVLTQVARGSLDQVTVRMEDVPTEQGTLDSVTVVLNDVTTSAPRIAQSVEARAVVPLSTLQPRLGDSWTISVEGDALKVAFTGAVQVEALVVPVVKDGAVTVDLRSVTLLGVEIQGDSVPGFVTDALRSMVSSFTELPFGLTPQSVAVTPAGVEVVATGTDVDLGSATG